MIREFPPHWDHFFLGVFSKKTGDGMSSIWPYAKMMELKPGSAKNLRNHGDPHGDPHGAVIITWTGGWDIPYLHHLSSSNKINTFHYPKQMGYWLTLDNVGIFYMILVRLKEFYGKFFTGNPNLIMANKNALPSSFDFPSNQSIDSPWPVQLGL